MFNIPPEQKSTSAVAWSWTAVVPQTHGKNCICAVGHILETVLVKIATFCEFDENNRIFTTSFGLYLGHTIRHFYTSHPEKAQRMVFEKYAISKN
jgi:hypothetical protein